MVDNDDDKDDDEDILFHKVIFFVQTHHFAKDALNAILVNLKAIFFVNCRKD